MRSSNDYSVGNWFRVTVEVVSPISNCALGEGDSLREASPDKTFVPYFRDMMPDGTADELIILPDKLVNGLVCEAKNRCRIMVI